MRARLSPLVFAALALGACSTGTTTAPLMTASAPGATRTAAAAGDTEAYASPPTASNPAPEFPAKPGAEFIVWYTPKAAPGTLESAWIRERADGSYEVLATRPEPVVSEGQSLWALRAVEVALPSEPATPGLRTLARAFKRVTLGNLIPDDGRADPMLPDEALRADVRYDDPPRLAGAIGPNFFMRLSGVETLFSTTKPFDETRSRTLVRSGDRRNLRVYVQNPQIGIAGLVQFEDGELRAAFAGDAAAEACANAQAEGKPLDLTVLGLRKVSGGLTVTWAAATRGRRERPVPCGTRERALDAKAAAAITSALAPSRAVWSALAERAAEGPVGFGPPLFSVPDPGQADRLGAAPDDEPAPTPTRDAVFAAFADRATLPQPSEQAPSDAALALLQTATQQLAKNELAPASATFDKLIALAPELGRAWLGRGHAKLLSGDLAGARADLEAALTHEKRPSFASDAHVDLAAVAERAGDADARLDHLVHAQALNPSGDTQAKLDALGLVLVRFAPDATGDLPAHLVSAGFPAISEDGTLHALDRVFGGGMSGYSARTFEVRRVADNRVVFQRALYSVGDDARERDTPSAAFLATMASGVDAINKALGAQRWSPTKPFDDHDDTASRGTPHPFVSADSRVAVLYREPLLVLDIQDAPRLFVRRLPLTAVDGECTNQAGIASVRTDPNGQVVLVTFDYDGTDTCLEPDDVTRAFRIPSPKQHAGWREAPRDPAPSWLDTERQRHNATDDGAPGTPLDDEARKAHEAFLATWGPRYPDAPEVKAVRARLARR